MRRYTNGKKSRLTRLRRALRGQLRDAPLSPYTDGVARRIGTLAGEIFRRQEELSEATEHPIPGRLHQIRERIANRDTSNTSNDMFWLFKYLEGFVLIPKQEFDHNDPRWQGITYIKPGD